MVRNIFEGSYTTQEIAQLLLGHLLVHDDGLKRVSGFIVETEAYLGSSDMAAHSYTGRRTKRTEAMFQEAGTIYIYTMHTHMLFNIAAQEQGIPEAILVRAVEPYEGIETMENNRGKSGFALTNGPGNLTKAMGITMDAYGGSIFGESVFIDPDVKKAPKKIVATPRIGIDNKGIWTHKDLRYIVADNPYVSRRKGKFDTTSYGWQ